MMRATLEGELGAGRRPGRAVDRAGAAARGADRQFGFDDLKATALGVLARIARAAVRGGVQAVAGGGSLGGVLAGLLGGLPGRATGGPVTPVAAMSSASVGLSCSCRPRAGGWRRRPCRGARRAGDDPVQAGAGDAPAALQRSSRQVARAVRRRWRVGRPVSLRHPDSFRGPLGTGGMVEPLAIPLAAEWTPERGRGDGMVGSGSEPRRPSPLWRHHHGALAVFAAGGAGGGGAQPVRSTVLDGQFPAADDGGVTIRRRMRCGWMRSSIGGERSGRADLEAEDRFDIRCCGTRRRGIFGAVGCGSAGGRRG